MRSLTTQRRTLLMTSVTGLVFATFGFGSLVDGPDAGNVVVKAELDQESFVAPVAPDVEPPLLDLGLAPIDALASTTSTAAATSTTPPGGDTAPTSETLLTADVAESTTTSAPSEDAGPQTSATPEDGLEEALEAPVVQTPTTRASGPTTKASGPGAEAAPSQQGATTARSPQTIAGRSSANTASNDPMAGKPSPTTAAGPRAGRTSATSGSASTPSNSAVAEETSTTTAGSGTTVSASVATTPGPGTSPTGGTGSGGTGQGGTNAPTTAAPTTAAPTTVAPTTTPTTATPTTSRPAVSGGPSPGVNFEEWNVPDGDRARALDLLAAGGMEWLRVDVGWRSFELDCDDCYSQWYIDRIDTLIADAGARGLDVMLTVGETPSWANGGDKLAPPNDPAEYGEFMTWLANHYRGRVIGYEIWNEPDLEKFFHGDVGDYVELLQAAYRGVKAADPNGTVVFGGPSHQDARFISAAYAAGAGGYFDVMATHPYQGGSDKPPDHPTDGNDWWMTEQPTITELMRRNGDGHKEVWWTEFAWSVGPNHEGLPSYRRGVTEAQQGQYLVESLQLAAERYPNVTRAAWYNGLERVDADADSWTRGYALIKRDMTPRPALDALRRYTRGG